MIKELIVKEPKPFKECHTSTVLERDNGNFLSAWFGVKLLQHYIDLATDFPDCGYPGLEIFADGSVLATTYLRYRPHDQYNSLVCVKFNPSIIQHPKREALV